MTRTPRLFTVLACVAALSFATIGTVTTTASAAAQSGADPKSEVTFLVGLPIKSKALQAAAVAVSSPGSPRYRHYLSLKDATTRYGVSAANEAKFAKLAARAGLASRTDATRLFARVTGTVAAWERLIGEPIEFQAAAAGSAQAESGPRPFNEYAFSGSGSSGLAPVPAAWKSAVTWFVPVYEQYVVALDVPGAPPVKSFRDLFYPGLGTASGPTNGGTPLGTTCQPSEVSTFTFTPDQLSTAYGLGPLQDAIKAGAQPSIAIVSLGGGFAQSDLDLGAKCFGYKSPEVDVRTGKGISTPIVSLSDESALDLQTVAWAARNLDSVRFAQVVNAPTGNLEAFALALTGWDTPPDAMTSSFGECELAPSGGDSNMTVDDILQLAGVVGTSAFVASGDLGSSTCQLLGLNPANPLPTIQYPGSSPYITAVGGTQLNLGPNNVRVGESVWNDLQYGGSGNAVGTGGPSAIYGAPWYQRPLARSAVRNVPDIAAQAGETPGTVIYFGGEPIGPLGGTSQAAPMAATGFAMISAGLRAEGKPTLGFVNPWLYRTARFHSKAFVDITAGSTQYPVEYAPQSLNFTACCQAGPGYDTASGLGAPLFDKLTQLVARVPETAQSAE